MKRLRILFPALLALVTLQVMALPPAGAGDGSVVIRGRTIRNWTYQLQGKGGRPLDLEELRTSAFEACVIDYSATGDADGEFSPEQIAALKQGSSGPRLVLAYLSLGEAEDYRFYWDPAWVDRRGRPAAKAPTWLAAVNPQWRGNFKVRYWEPTWKSIVFGTQEGPQRSYLDRVLDQGFDGVYLDIIDAYEYFGPDGQGEERQDAAAQMALLVRQLAAYARETRGRTDFVVVPQNGSGILAQMSPEEAAAYLEAIDAIGAEDSFYFGPRAMNNPYRPQTETLQALAAFRDAGKPVLSVDYVSQPARVRRYYQEARAAGFLPYAARRALDRITVIPGLQPPP